MPKIAYSKAALKYLMGLPARQRQRIVAAVANLAEGRRADVRPLAGRPGHHRLRVGGFRVIWKWSEDGTRLEILAVGPRGGIYR
jgi:mRNA interferase RelE/StbE